MPQPLVVVGASLGGLEALRVLVGALPANLQVAVVIVQHRLAGGSGDLALLLGQASSLATGFPLDKEEILPSHVYVAPPDYHLLIEDDHFAFSLDPPENYARPSIDILFESAADAHGAELTGIILTGMGRDGARGLAAIHAVGGQVIVQSPREAYSPEMPLSALALVPQVQQLTLTEIGAYLVQRYGTRIVGATSRSLPRATDFETP